MAAQQLVSRQNRTTATEGEVAQSEADVQETEAGCTAEEEVSLGDEGGLSALAAESGIGVEGPEECNIRLQHDLNRTSA